MKEFQKRSIFGLLFAIVILGSILAGPWTFALVFGFFSVMILREFYHLAGTAGLFPQKKVGLTMGGTIFVLTFLNLKGVLSVSLAGLILPMLFVIPILELYRAKSNALENVAVTIFGILYISMPISLFSLYVFPNFPSGGRYDPDLLIILFILVWVYDSGAYLFGVTMGKHRLFERISPKKSWEGFFGGMLLSVVVAILINLFFSGYDLKFLIPFAIAISASGTVGDLFESLIKRNLGIKDSGNFMPGHGGWLDRFDSILFASPFVYIVIILFG